MVFKSGFDHKNVSGEVIAEELIRKYDFVIDCADNFRSRYIINENCVKLNVSFVYGGVLAWSGQTFTIMPGMRQWDARTVDAASAAQMLN